MNIRRMAGQRERLTGWTVAASVWLFACERKTSPGGNDSAVSVATPPAAQADSAVARRAWREGDGPYLVVSTDDARLVLLVAPESTAQSVNDAVAVLTRGTRATIDLLGRSGLIARVSLQPGARVLGRDCEWPRAALDARDSLAEEARWGAGFARSVAAPFALDSIERLSHGDSLRLVADIARLASSLPDDTVAAFHGIPFAVRGAWSFAPAPGVRAVIAEISRRVAQEANQREERLLLLAEKDTAAASRWQARWWTRANGSEETVEALDALAVVRLARDAWPTFVVGHDAPNGLWHELVVRDSTGSWRRRWRSGVSGGC